ncbi:MAG: lysophospholipase [Alphaproteobacteria bacterium]|nr:lysophospholipase [Alphaproteobacteria bacterium]MBU0795937.1 lysophospholipase [Alphaproteobacteria bacterium]MBU0886974.1 lysophospholipase [Alphaproteobacteria bacterium]MBU1813170.1 lysophospholipase [Alphaproteobacteria bacterium]MBU2092077.1 lysophospholipase [Alphaproteobacteria bacterium]
MRLPFRLVIAMGLLAMAAVACVPSLAPLGGVPSQPALTPLKAETAGGTMGRGVVADPAVLRALDVEGEHGQALMPDGLALPYDAYRPLHREPRGVIVALHGFNDYRGAYRLSGPALAAQGQVVYAYDQRGFGDSPFRGRWAGTERLTADLAEMVELVRGRHPGLPVTILGHSMGGAVTLAAMGGANPPRADRVVLAAPAVWGRSTMPFYQTAALWIGAHTLPWMTVTGRGLGKLASDNLDMLRQLGRDPRVIKETRLEAIWGLVNLMDDGLESAARLHIPALILYGARDEIVPSAPVCRMLRRLPLDEAQTRRIAVYPEGWHMMLRDLHGPLVQRDISAWLADPRADFASAADIPDGWPRALCGPGPFDALSAAAGS